MIELLLRLGPAVALNGLAAIVSVRRSAVTAGGGVAGFTVGAAVYAAGGPWLWSLLMIFFVSGTAISRVGGRRKAALQQSHEKGRRRDAVQVFANGGVAMVAALAYGATGEPLFAAACAVSFAASNADTWAGEIGVLSARPPRCIVRRRRLPAGASGGVSALGTVTAAVAAAVIAAAFLAGWAPRYGWEAAAGLAAVVTGAGFAGALIDSVLGATVQAHYTDPVTGGLTERRFGSAGENRLVRGLRGFNNDAVNLASNLLAVAVALPLLALLL